MHLSMMHDTFTYDALRDLVLFVQFKKRENTHRWMLLLVKLQAKACNFTKSNILPRVFFKYFKLYKWYQIVSYYMTDHALSYFSYF